MKKFIPLIFFAFVAAQAPPSFKLKEVRVEGNKETSENMVLYTAGLQAGQDVSTEDFRRAAKRLWELGVFSNIQQHYEGASPEDPSLIHIPEPTSPGRSSYAVYCLKKKNART